MLFIKQRAIHFLADWNSKFKNVSYESVTNLSSRLVQITIGCVCIQNFGWLKRRSKSGFFSRGSANRPEVLNWNTSLRSHFKLFWLSKGCSTYE